MNSNIIEPDMMVKLIIIAAIGAVLLIVSHFVLSNGILKKDKLHRRFLGKLFNLVVIIVCLVNIIELLSPAMNMRNIFWKGSALIVAILGFAAQPAISDLICGFLISINKPFDIGDRIIVEGFEPGIVTDITLRHTVLTIYDGIKIVIPNSVLNSKTITNTTKTHERRGIHLTYSVSYDTDVRYAMDVIRDCVVASPYTLTVETNGITEDSGPVYFLKFDTSALILETTIWVTYNTNTYVAATDMNMRVNKAFRERGIEIPYNFVNVVNRKAPETDDETPRAQRKKSPSKRNFRTDTAMITAENEKLEAATALATRFSDVQRLDEKSRSQLMLMVEELVGISRRFVDKEKIKLWIEGSGVKYRIHSSFPANIDSDKRKELLSLSFSGKNEAADSLREKILEKVFAGIRTTDNQSNNIKDYEWSLYDNEPSASEIGESILAALADDIKVSVTKERVELVIIKTLIT